MLFIFATPSVTPYTSCSNYLPASWVNQFNSLAQLHRSWEIRRSRGHLVTGVVKFRETTEAPTATREGILIYSRRHNHNGVQEASRVDWWRCRMLNSHLCRIDWLLKTIISIFTVWYLTFFLHFQGLLRHSLIDAMASFEERRVIKCINYALPHYPLVLRSAKTPNVTVADSDSEKLTRKNQVSAKE